MTGFWADLVHAVRRLATAPGFTIAAVLSIGIGLGANTAVFTVANELLLKPLAVPRSGELVRIYRNEHSPLTGRMLREAQSAQSFAHVFGETSFGGALAVDNAEPERVRVSLTSDNFYQGLAVVPVAGRLFIGDSTASGAELVLTHEFWLRRFGGTSEVIGKSVRLNNQTFTVIGVAPPGRGTTVMGWWADVVVPARDARAVAGVPVDSIGGRFYTSARLAAGRTMDDADSELQLIGSRIMASDTALRRLTLVTRPARGVTEEMRTPAAVASAFLGAIALLVLIMAATNVGNLMLARNAARQRELGVRVALGASRSRLLRLLLAESMVLATLAAGVAWLIATWVTTSLPGVLPQDAEVRFNLSPDWRVFVGTIAATGMAILLFGLIPARVALRRDVAVDIKEGSAIGRGAAGTSTRRRFLMVQVALCALLLATGSLFVRSLANAGSVDIGFRPQGIVTAWVDVGGRSMTPTQQVQFFERLLADVRESPGVAAVTYSRVPELTGSNSETELHTDAMPADAPVRRSYFNTVGADYHGTLGIPLVKGRDFATTDGPESPRVAIVNETFAAREWPGEDPLIHRVSFEGAQGPWYQVIGVSRNARYHTLGEGPKAFVSVPHTQSPSSELIVEARVAAGASERDVMQLITSLVRGIDPLVAPPRTQPLVDMQKLALLPARAGAAILGGIGAIAFVLAAVGVGGVAAYTVAQRTREIGVRMALGASPASLLRALLHETWTTVLRGAVVGLVLAVGVGRLLASQLYGISFADPVTFALVPVLLLVLAVAAAFVPARRALRVSPIEALRAE